MAALQSLITNSAGAQSPLSADDEIAFSACIVASTSGLFMMQAHFSATMNPGILFNERPFEDIDAGNLDLELAILDPSSAFMQVIRDIPDATSQDLATKSLLTELVVSGTFEQGLYRAYMQPGLSACFLDQDTQSTPACVNRLIETLEVALPDCYVLFDRVGMIAAVRNDLATTSN